MELALKNIIKSLSESTDQNFYEKVVAGLSSVTGADYVFIAKINQLKKVSRTLAAADRGVIVNNFKYKTEGAPCEWLAKNEDIFYSEDLLQHYPDSKMVASTGASAYIGTPLLSNAGEVVGIIVALNKEPFENADVIRNIFSVFSVIVSSEMARAEQSKRIKLFGLAMEHASEGMILTDSKNNIVEVNESFQKVSGYRYEELVGKNPRMFSIGLNNKIAHQEMWAALRSGMNWKGEIVNKTITGDLLYQWVSITVLRDSSGDIEYYYAVFNDLTEMKKKDRQIEYMVYHDALTSLKNLQALEKYIGNLEHPVSLIMLNVDNFSYINTAYGFNIGDEILKEAANLLKSNFNADSYYRINSDEFAIVYEKEIDIEKKITSIQNFFNNIVLNVGSLMIKVTFTYGGTYGVDKLLRNCALALKQAKESGKNRFHVFSGTSLNIDHGQRSSFILANTALHKAIEENRLLPFFQGIRNNASGEIDKYECLVRIIQEDGKIISPYSFLEPARLSGLLPKITQVMIDRSFEKMSELKCDFSINITEDDLSLGYLISYLKEKTVQYGVEPSRVILEVLEGVSSGGKKNHTSQLKAIRTLGYRIAIDDFGAEYSNFERVLDLDVDFLKIDSKYIKDIHTNKKSFEVTRAIVFFAHNVGIPCVAEFVHNEEVQEIVSRLGIEYSQGFHFSEPREDV